MADPYVYPGTSVLRNRLNLRDADALSRAEATAAYLATLELGTRRIAGSYDLRHLRNFHYEIFGDVYPWAGEIRTIDIAKSNSYFAHHGFIEQYLTSQLSALAAENHLQGLPQERFVERVAFYLGEVNAAHPFREGNGRTQRAFFAQLARDAGYRIAWERLDEQRNIDASIASHDGNIGPLREMLTDLVEPLRLRGKGEQSKEAGEGYGY